MIATTPSRDSDPPVNPTPPAPADDAVAALLRQFEVPEQVAALARQSAARVAELQLGADAERAAALYPLWEAGIVDDAILAAEQPRAFALAQGIARLRVIDDLQPNPEGLHGPAQLDRVRNMLLTIAEDVRVVVIKLCQRADELAAAKHWPEPRRRQLAQQTLNLYAPLASRLGIWQLKWLLEDYCLRYLEPEVYHRIAHWLDERRTDRERYIEQAVAAVDQSLRAAGIEAGVSGRPKHIYSIWRKLQRKAMAFDALFDVRGVRVLVADVSACYAALGVVHGRWQPIPGQFNDYIASPKENQYRSLHTAVIGPRGRTLEVQIRTQQMHEEAELGVAAHWRYKEGNSEQRGSNIARITWLRRLLEAGDEPDAEDMLARLHSEMGEDRIYAITPGGDVLDLPQGATAVDFAYAVHTDVGHRCRGARINGQIAQLTQPLRQGDRVEILTAREPKPSRDWLTASLGYAVTPRARARIRQYFRQQDRERNILAGRTLLDRELQRLRLHEVTPATLASACDYSDAAELHAALGSGQLSLTQVIGRLPQEPAPLPPALPTGRQRTGQGTDVFVPGVGTLLTSIAGCCRPLPPEPIAGYVTRRRGVSVHRQDCASLLRLTQQAPERRLEVQWGARPAQQSHPMTIRVEAYDRQGLLRDISDMLSAAHINVLGANTATAESGIARMDLRVEIADIPQLSSVLNRLSRLPHVISASRLN